MKNIKAIILLSLTCAAVWTQVSCTKGLESINTNPNNPEIVPTYTIFNGANRLLFDNNRDGWWMTRMSMPWMQYCAQNNYVEEDKYQYRDNQTTNGWSFAYRSANNFKDIIEKCEDPLLSTQMATYGNLANQIAVSRIMLVYVFDNLVTHFGPVPYWSYGQRGKENFQALDITRYIAPVYVSEEEIYVDLLNELKEAAEQLVIGQPVFSQGDNIYGGDASKWRLLANSLRLRIANRIKTVYPEANAEIQDAIANGVIRSNVDNAVHSFQATALEGNPLWKTFYADNRTDFWVNRTFMDLLKGTTGSFGLDPRLQKISAPTGLTFAAYNAPTGFPESNDLNDYPGMPYGLPRVETYYSQANINFFSKDILRGDRGEILIEYSEVAFILSELNSWSQDEYENGVRANMQRLGVSAAATESFIANLPIASERSVMNQKYITLFFNPDEAWNEYRRTGFPDTEILLMPGESTTRPHDGSIYTFIPLQSGNVIATDLPARVRYPVPQQTLNRVNWSTAAVQFNGDEIDRKLYFAKR